MSAEHTRGTRRELAALALLTAPILVSQVSQAAYGFIDTLMAGQVSPGDLAAVAIGSSLWLPLYLLATGTLLATTPLVAEAHGAGQRERIPGITHQALWLALIIGVLGWLLLRHAWPLFAQLGVPDTLHVKTRLYLEGISWGMPAVGLFYVLRCYCEAQGRPLPVTVICVAGPLMNIPLNQIFIHGSASVAGLAWLGVPALGGPGCGWATAVVMWVIALILLVYVLSTRAFTDVRLLRQARRPSLGRIGHVAALGLPIGIAVFFEVSSFALVAVLVSPAGAQVVAGHQIALSVTSMLFMVPLSLAIALTIRTGQHYGARDLTAIRRTRRVGLTATALIACVSAVFLYCARHAITRAYSDDAGVTGLAAQLLLFAVAYQVVDALQVGAAGCLRGLQDTRSPMRLTLVAYWIVAIPFGYVAGSTTLLGRCWGVYGYWSGLVLGLTAASLLLNLQLRRRVRELQRTWTHAG